MDIMEVLYTVSLKWGEWQIISVLSNHIRINNIVKIVLIFKTT
jgi:hypothetical protein